MRKYRVFTLSGPPYLWSLLSATVPHENVAEWESRQTQSVADSFFCVEKGPAADATDAPQP
jgi:hypothetical protein